jgi:hypothetical protein
VDLASTNGNRVTLSIERYEYPARDAMGDEDWDANWLVVSGHVVDAARVRLGCRGA